MLAERGSVRQDRPHRWRQQVGVAAALLGVLIAGTGVSATPRPQATSSPEHRLTVESVQVEGNSRTPRGIVLEAAGLTAGDAATPESILAAAERLRHSGLFRHVEVRTRPGSAPGYVRIVFSVDEQRPHLRFGLGYEDLSGWYLIPIQLNLDNLTGRGETMRLSSRLGYRVSGLVFDWKSRQLSQTKTVFGIRGRIEALERIYFVDDTEISHPVERAGVDFRLSRRILEPLTIEGWISGEKVVPDSSAKVYRENKTGERRQGDRIEFDDLPGVIRRDLDEVRQTRAGIAIVLDHATGEGLRNRGLRGRVAIEGVRSSEEPFGLWQSELRGYLPIGEGLQLAARLRAGSVSSEAPFYERFYLGGLYTVRGYPSQSLSPTQGHLNAGSLSIELRSAWMGPAQRPLLSGQLFYDLAFGGNEGLPGSDGVFAGIGYGLRYRLPWVGLIGLDVGHPLSSAPVDESFHVNLSIGMTF